MSDNGHVELTNDAIRGIYNAAVTYTQRFLPTVNAELKGARLRRWVAPLDEVTKEVQNKIVAKYPDAHKNPAENTAMLLELNAMLCAKVSVVLPNIRITDADLPKVLKGDDGEKNRVGVSEIMANLGPFYQFAEEDT